MAAEHPVPDLPSISAAEIHKNNLQAFKLENKAHHRLIAGIRALNHENLVRELTFPSIYEYCKKFFSYGRTMTYECIRVAEALDALPACQARYEAGKVSFSALRAITRFEKLSKKNEERWLDFAQGHSVQEIEDEVEAAETDDRDRPREGDQGLTNRFTTVSIRLTLEEKHLVMKAFAKVGSEIRESLGKDCRPDPRRILFFMAERMLETDPAGTPKGRVERDESLYSILYRVSLDGTRAQLIAGEGPVEVPIEHVKRIEGEARKVTIRPEDEVEKDREPGSPAIDPPASRSLRKKVIHADGRKCVVCGRKLKLQADHRKERSKGGRTHLKNLESLCVYCHSLKTQGLITLEKAPDCGFIVTRNIEGLEDDFEVMKKDLEALPRVVMPEYTRVDAGGERGGQYTRVYGAARPGGEEGANGIRNLSDRLEDLVLVLGKVGCREPEARKRLDRAILKLRATGCTAPTDNQILRAAVSGG